MSTWPRWLLLGAFALAAISLLFAWEIESVYTIGPQVCYTRWENGFPLYMCDPGVGTTTQHARLGYQGRARVWLALTALLTWQAVRRSSSGLARCALVAAVVGICASGGPDGRGPMLAVVSIGMLTLAFHRLGLLRLGTLLRARRPELG